MPIRPRRADVKSGKAKVAAAARQRRGQVEQQARIRRRNQISKRRKPSALKEQGVVNYSDEEIQQAVQALAQQTVPPSAFRKLRLMLSEWESPIERVVELGVVPLLIRVLHGAQGVKAGPDIQVLIDVVWCLTNIASGTTKLAKCVLPSAPYFISFLASGVVPLQEISAWALGNLAGESSDFRQVLTANGVLPPLCALLQSSTEVALLEEVAWCISNMAQGQAPLEQLLKANIVPALLAQLKKNSSPALVSQIAWLLSYFTAQNGAVLQLVVKAGLVQQLLALVHVPLSSAAAPFAAKASASSSSPLSSSSSSPSKALPKPQWAHSSDEEVRAEQARLIPYVRIIGHVAAGPDEYTDLLLQNKHTIEVLRLCLGAKHRALKKEGAWAISNIAGGRAEHVTAVAVLLEPMCQLLVNTQFDIQKEVAFGLWNLARDPRSEQSLFRRMVGLGVVPCFMQFMMVPDAEANLLGLRFAQKLLDTHPDGSVLVQEARGIDGLEHLMRSDNDELYEVSTRLMDKYFGEDVDFDVDDGNATMTQEPDDSRAPIRPTSWAQVGAAQSQPR